MPIPSVALKTWDQGEILGLGIRDGIICNLASLLVTCIIGDSESLALKELMGDSQPEA